MKLTVDIECFADSILDTEARDKFKQRYDIGSHPWGIEVQTYDKWTTKQQGKIWRDFTLASKLLETTPDMIYYVVRTNPLTKQFFEKESWVGAKGRGKTIVGEKGLSQFTKNDCIEAIPVILELLQSMVDHCYQEHVIINWSNRENEMSVDWEFTGVPHNF